MKTITILLLAGLISSNYCIAQGNSAKALLQEIRKSSLQRKCYYQQQVSLGDSLSKVMGLLGEPDEKYSVESVGYYRYSNYAFGFLKSLQSSTDTDIVALFDYFIDLNYADLIDIMGNHYTVQADPEYRTFTLRYRIDTITFDFIPQYGADIEKRLSIYDPLTEREAYEKNAKLYVSRCSYCVLTVFQSMR